MALIMDFLVRLVGSRILFQERRHCAVLINVVSRNFNQYRVQVILVQTPQGLHCRTTRQTKMHISTISTLGLLLSLPLAAVAQSRCQSDMITTDKDKEYSVAVNFDSASKKYTATVTPGDMSLTIPALSITNNGGYKRLFCLASEPDRPRSDDNSSVDTESAIAYLCATAAFIVTAE
ncbi:uncharacterized protein CLUP02_04384 [Colletotrichum lupini]|uniref:Uncharacterized protein n=1 Tax=Colletotrichum lupini TaxID=145971 RepID=A0A9Q8WDQ1_9PEZI|nr:uncharacterized protein CLUP02_04384 [Colletotrichum lupini]UQC78905.1 hypothetical protein CLUP02_04384 [Colletotrichum lupini]